MRLGTGDYHTKSDNYTNQVHTKSNINLFTSLNEIGTYPSFLRHTPIITTISCDEDEELLPHKCAATDATSSL